MENLVSGTMIIKNKTDFISVFLCYNLNRGDNMKGMLAWTFLLECAIPNDIGNILVPGEEAVAAYKTIRDSAIFTNKRIIIRDAQGLTGTKIEMYSIPYSSIIMWSTENAGTIDLNSEVEIWTRAGNFKINLKRGIDIRKFDNLIGRYVL